MYTMLPKVANPFGKQHKTKQKRDSREAIATPLRKQKKTKKMFTLIRE